MLALYICIHATNGKHKAVEYEGYTFICTFPRVKGLNRDYKSLPEIRWSRGLGSAKNQHMAAAIAKYGWDSFSHEILFNGLTKEQAEQKEVELIREFQAHDRNFGYNLALGGKSKGMVSDEQKAKISRSMQGIKRSAETRARMSRANKGVKKSDEVRAQIRKAIQAGERHMPCNLGRKLTEECKEKIRESKRNTFTPVVQIGMDGKVLAVYDSTREASRQTGVPSGNISRCCRSNNRSK